MSELYRFRRDYAPILREKLSGGKIRDNRSVNFPPSVKTDSITRAISPSPAISRITRDDPLAPLAITAPAKTFMFTPRNADAEMESVIYFCDDGKSSGVIILSGMS